MEGVILQVNQALATQAPNFKALDTILSDVEATQGKFKDLRIKLEEEEKKFSRQ